MPKQPVIPGLREAMKDWHSLKPELFKKQPYYLAGCDR